MNYIELKKDNYYKTKKDFFTNIKSSSLFKSNSINNMQIQYENQMQNISYTYSMHHDDACI